MNWALLLAGIAVLGLAMTDLFITALMVEGGGPLTRWMVRGLWRGLRRLGRHSPSRRLLTLAGPLIAALALVAWVACLWAGWALIFNAGETAIVRATTGEPADAWTRIYFAGYTVFTLGLGDYRPEGDAWQIATTLAVGSGLLTATLAVTYLVPIVSAAASRRQVAGYISSLGRTPEQIVRRAWDGDGFPLLGQHLATLTPMIIAESQKQLVYPVLHHFHTREPRMALTVQLATLNEAVCLLRFGIAPEVRLPSAALHPVEEVIGMFMDTLRSAEMGSIGAVPPAPRLDLLRQAGIPTVAEVDFRQALEAQADARKQMLALLSGSSWAWTDVTEG